MIKNKIAIDLDVNLNHIKSISLKQYNQNSQWLIIRITENGKPFYIEDDDICIFKMCTPDKREIYNDCVFVDNCIVVEITQNCCTNYGTGNAELNILDAEKKAQIASFNFNIVIEKSVFDNENIEGSNEYGALVDRIIAADKAIENAEIATDNATTAAENANAATKDLQDKLDSHHFVLTEDKDVANGVPSLDEHAKVPISELYDATTTQKGITQLTDSITSTSTSTAATPNSVKKINDAVNAEQERAIESEGNLESKKANLASPTFTGIPNAPTASVGTSTTQIATTEFVQTSVSNGIAASDSMIIKGTIGHDTETGIHGTIDALPTTYKTGWTYRVVADGTYAGQICEIGDLIIALIDRNGSNNMDSDWCVAQTNINGAITGVRNGDDYIECSQSGSVITIKHTDVSRTNTTSTVSPSNGGSFTAVKSVVSDEKGHITGVDTETVTIPPGALTKFLTQAEYDALPLEVQKNGTIYFITDSDGEIGENTEQIEMLQTQVDKNTESISDVTKEVGLLKSYFPLHFSTAAIEEDLFSTVVTGSGFQLHVSQKAYRKIYKVAVSISLNIISTINPVTPLINVVGGFSGIILLMNSAPISPVSSELSGRLHFLVFSNATTPYAVIKFFDLSTGNVAEINTPPSSATVVTNDSFQILTETNDKS